MKIIRKILAAAVIMFCSVGVHAQSIGDILGNLGSGSKSGGVGDILSGVIEGVFTKSNLTLADLVGEYQAEGPAVTFKSDNFLQKAGGLAGAAKIESELKPYYDQYGLNNMTLTVDENANFTMKIKALSLKGNITRNDADGTFEFHFKVVGISLGSFTAYIEKSGRNLRLMFDATKLKNFVSTVAKFTGNSMAKAMGSILDSYEGACIGFKMVSTSTAPEQTNPSGTGTEGGNQQNSVSKGLDTLKDILNSNKNK